MIIRDIKGGDMLSNTSSTETEKVFQICNYFIKKAKANGEVITNKKVQKLLYYAQAWSVTLRDKTLFDEPVEAWVHGPAIKKVYDRFSQFGRDDIASQYSVAQLVTTDIDEDENELLKVIWDNYGKYTAEDLEMLAHSESPWQKARAGVEPYMASTNEITIGSMKEFYGQKARQASQAA